MDGVNFCAADCDHEASSLFALKLWVNYKLILYYGSSIFFLLIFMPDSKCRHASRPTGDFFKCFLNEVRVCKLWDKQTIDPHSREIHKIPKFGFNHASFDSK